MTSLTATTTEIIIENTLGNIITLFTANIGTILTFAVSFIVLTLLLALARRFFRV